MSTDYRGMTDAEFEAHWDARHAQLDRVDRRTWLYAIPVAACEVALLQGALFLAGVLVWPLLWAFLLAGIVAARVGRVLAWRREGGKPDYLRRRGGKP